MMKWISCLALTAIWLAGVSPHGATAAERCVAYGDENTDFTWRLCPGGEKYERQYLYFGVWSNFRRVANDAGACRWSPARASWICPDRTIRCDAKRCE
jgi:hypothetical protein